MKINKSIATLDMAQGIRVPTTVENAQDFLLNRVRDYISTPDKEIYEVMDLCDKLYRYEGTCGNAIDIFVEFAVTVIGAEETGKKDIDLAIQFFNKQVNQNVTSTIRGLQEVVSKLGLDFWVKGNGFPYTSWYNTDVPGAPASMKLPMRIVCLNPQLVNIPKSYQSFGHARLFLRPSYELEALSRQDGRSNPGVKDLKDLGIMKKTRENDGYPLNPKFISHLKRKGRDYEAWGLPYLTRAFSSVASIRRLRRLDDATTEGLANYTTIYKIGDKDHPASQGRLIAFSQLLKHNTPTSTLVWAHDVETIQVAPDSKILAFEKKYVEPRQELLRALGIPAILIDPSLAKGQDPWASVIVLTERLQKFRDMVGNWIEDVYHQIAVENGYPDLYPKVKWERMNLSNDQAIKNLIMQFYDRGLIDAETALEEANYDYDSVLNKKKRHQRSGEDALFVPPQLPFGGPNEKPGEKGRPKKGSPKDKADKKIGTKPAVDQKVQKKPASPKAKAEVSEVTIDGS
jgi:hypothetical protein